jgi:hypothetical protein
MIPSFSTSLPRPIVEFGIQPPRKYLKTKQKWNLEFNHLGKIQKQKRTRPVPDSSPRDLATSSDSIHESFQSHPPNPLSIRESFQSHFSIRESFQSHFFEPVSDPRFILVPKLVANFFEHILSSCLRAPIWPRLLQPHHSSPFPASVLCWREKVNLLPSTLLTFCFLEFLLQFQIRSLTTDQESAT